MKPHILACHAIVTIICLWTSWELAAGEFAFKSKSKRTDNYIVVHSGDIFSVMTLRTHSGLLGADILPFRAGPFAVDSQKAKDLSGASSLKELLASPPLLLKLLRRCESENFTQIAVGEDIVILGAFGGSSDYSQWRGVNSPTLMVEARAVRATFPVTSYNYRGPESGDQASLIAAAITRLPQLGRYDIIMELSPKEVAGDCRRLAPLKTSIETHKQHFSRQSPVPLFCYSQRFPRPTILASTLVTVGMFFCLAIWFLLRPRSATVRVLAIAVVASVALIASMMVGDSLTFIRRSSQWIKMRHLHACEADSVATGRLNIIHNTSGCVNIEVSGRRFNIGQDTENWSISRDIHANLDGQNVHLEFCEYLITRITPVGDGR